MKIKLDTSKYPLVSTILPDNTMRADRIREILDLGEEFQQDDAQDELTDLLTDIMHFSHRLNLNFDKCLSAATDHFSEEKK